MTLNELKGAMIAAGITGRELARKLNITDQAVSAVVRGVNKTARVRKVIAEAISRPVDEIWSDNEKMPVEQ